MCVVVCTKNLIVTRWYSKNISPYMCSYHLLVGLNGGRYLGNPL